MHADSIELNNNISKVVMQNNLMLKKYLLNSVKNIVINT